MATPVLDKELVKLRRRLGDVFTEGKVEITTANIGSVGGNIWTVAEIVDLYNDAVKDYLDLVINTVPRKEWYSLIPGYVFYNPAVDIASGVLALAGITPALRAVLGLTFRKTADFVFEFIYVNPNEWLTTKNGKFPNRRPSDKELYFTVLSTSVSTPPTVVSDATFTATSTVISGFTGVTVNHVGGDFVGLDNGGNPFSRPITEYISATSFRIGSALVADGAGTNGYIIPPSADALASKLYTAPASTFDDCELIYIREHVDLIQGAASPDLSGISASGLRKILDFAEAEAIKQKQAVSPEYQQKLIELKLRSGAVS